MKPIPYLEGAIILLTYAGVAIGRVPGLRMNRATIALVGAALLIAMRTITEQQAFESLDLRTLVLLFAMMVINANLRMAGFFALVGDRVLRLARTPHALLALVVVASGVLSALFMNDPVCVLFTPLVVELTQRLRRDPIPYLLGLATAANVGSTATITGNPQNLIIGQASGIPYATFLSVLGPVALVGLVICWCVIVLLYRDEFRGKLEAMEMPSVRTYQPLLSRTMLVVGGLLVAFLIGLPIASSAFVAAGLLLISRLRPAKLLDVDGELLAFFSGLFIVTGAIEVTGLGERLFAAVSPLLQSGVPTFSLVTALTSNVVSNVPAVLLFRPEVAGFPNPTQAWLTLAMASTLSGNLTLLGSVANLIVAGIAEKRGVRLGFVTYLKVGVPITMLTIVIGVLWLLWRT